MHLVVQDLLIVGACDKVLKVVCTRQGKVGFGLLMRCQVSDDIGGDHGRTDWTSRYIVVSLRFEIKHLIFFLGVILILFINSKMMCPRLLRVFSGCLLLLFKLFLCSHWLTSILMKYG
jgi:hypothetical protein